MCLIETLLTVFGCKVNLIKCKFQVKTSFYFHYYEGCLPFSGNNSSSTQNTVFALKIKRKPLNRQMPQELRDDKPSDEFVDLLQSILQLDPQKRLVLLEYQAFNTFS